MTTRIASTRQPAVRSNRAVAVGAAVGALAGAVAGAGSSALVVGAAVGALAVAAGWPDLRERRIPNTVVLAGLAAAAVVAMVVAICGDRPVVASVVAGAALAGGLMLVLHLARPSSLGFGDVKLAAVLGAMLGIVHWTLAAVMLGFASLLGAAGAAAVVAWRRSIPFGTCMGVAAMATLAATSVLRDTVDLW